jgi:galactose-1-phosphate uridylyltransferase
MSQQIDREGLLKILQAEDVTALSFNELVRLFREEKGISDFLPDGVCRIDPRNGDRIIYNSSRARRPQDNRAAASRDPTGSAPCAVCQGRTTGVIDVAELSEGFTFINKNLYPSLYPLAIDRGSRSSGETSADNSDWDAESGRTPYGLHFLQWTSSLHDRDWHNMPLTDRAIVMRRLAALERKLLVDGRAFLPPSEPDVEQPAPQSYVLIIKNFGRLVGGSLAHGHQQIGLSNIMPRRIRDNQRFEQEKGEKFSAHLLRQNPAELLVQDYGSASLLVPYFMRRPYDMLLLVKDARKRYLHELSEEETLAVAEGWHDAIRAIRSIMSDIGKEVAYNVVTHNGPGAGLYFEFLPYTQETGGFEHLGLLVCQGNPQDAAARIRRHLES